MAKAFHKKYIRNGEVIHEQIWYWCKGCNDLHAFNPRVHQFNGDLNQPTVSPSLLQTGGKTCHSFIKAGVIQYLGDCQHDLAGQTIQLPDFETEFKKAYPKQELTEEDDWGGD